MSDLNGLALTRSERILVVALSYAWCTPLLYWFGERIFHYFGIFTRPRGRDQAGG